MQKKFGFTIAEIVIAMVIVGIVSVVGILSFKPEMDDKKRSGYYKQIYKTLKTAGYNAFLEEHGNFGKAGGDFETEGLCNSLTGQINTSENNCNEAGIGISTTDFRNITPHFKASNGIEFWIDNNVKPLNIQDIYNNPININLIKIYANIEPDKKTKILMDNDNPKGNVVPFYITQYGEVIPVGAPLNDPKIIQAGVKISYKYNDNGYVSEKSITVPAENFNDAKGKAWGGKVWANNPLSYSNYGTSTDINCPEGEPEDGTGTCQEVVVKIDKDKNETKDTVCCKVCEYNCTPIILNK